VSALRSFGSARGVLRRGFSAIDIAVFLALAIGMYLLLHIGRGLTVSLSAAGVKSVSTDPSHLPYDAARSLLRMFIALFFSIVFTFVYGYAAAHSRRAEKVLVPILDILQSVPVLGFLTFTVTAFVALFPGSELGLECAAIFAIFTAQAWNLTFSFYQSEKTLPRELDELSRSLRLTKWQRFWKIEVPNSAIGLVWNGMLSFGGSWFFLVAAETISLAGNSYHLPGIGSYVWAASGEGDLGKVGLGIATMIVMVVGVNIVFWRPLTAWCERYRNETTEAAEVQRSLVLDLLNRSSLPRVLGHWRAAAAEVLGRWMRVLGRDDTPPPVDVRRQRTIDVALVVAVGMSVAFGAYAVIHYVATAKDAGLGQFPHAFLLGAATFARVVVLLVFSTLVWVPIGVWIGLNPGVARLAQPVVQVLASFPANFIFPFATLLFIRVGLSLNIGGILLMALGAQWYILFNTIAGAAAIPSDLRESMAIYDVHGWHRWKRLIIPGILGSYVTGGITAAGGAWNASIVAEVVQYHNTTLSAYGLGAYIVNNASNHARPDLRDPGDGVLRRRRQPPGVAPAVPARGGALLAVRASFPA
jgi:NitT/TauT family transport system permease protein